MEQKKQNFNAEQEAFDPDATLVTTTPLFDDEAAQVARPVVPLAADSPDEIVNVGSVPASTGYAAHAGTQGSRAHILPAAGGRRSWLIALIGISILVGSVLGGAGLRFYQKRQAAKAQPEAATPSPAQTQAAQPTPPADLRSTGQTASLPAETSATMKEANRSDKPPAMIDAADKETVPVPPTRADAEDADRHSHKSKKDSEARREDNVDEEQAHATVKRGKKADSDDDRRGEVRPRLVGEYGGNGDDDRESRRAERRRARRERQQRPRVLDSVRSIFEGPPR